MDSGGSRAQAQSSRTDTNKEEKADDTSSASARAIVE